MVEEQKRILIVEDDPETKEVLNEALTEAGFATEQASSAEEAFAKLRKWRPHLVLSDHDMPGMTGLDLLKELRKRKNYVTVIFVSGRKDYKTVVEALRAGADDYIRKPFPFEELIARVEASLRNNEVHRELMEANEKLQEMVDRDHLTGLYNMRSMYERIDYELKACKQNDTNVACIMLDMDHFKRVNDENDHLFGSFVLKEVGAIIKKNIREVDFAARYGGDEFLIVLSNINAENTARFCERIRKTIDEYDFRDDNNHIKLTVSVGFVLSNNEKVVDARELVRLADNALYEAKDSGRNKVFQKAN
ncbi:MAG: diguanylate cyclase [Bdellovibrionales bacterium]|nr:diguanylate cyclase [Bdellovibrionales bacterium]